LRKSRTPYTSTKSRFRPQQKESVWKDRAAYKKGDYQLVYKCFESYFKFLSIGGDHHAIDTERTSDGMFGETGDSSVYVRQRMRQACLEDWDAVKRIVRT